MNTHHSSKRGRGFVSELPSLAEARLISEGIPVERSDKTGTAKMSDAAGRGPRRSFFAAELIKTFGVKNSAFANKPAAAHSLLGLIRYFNPHNDELHTRIVLVMPHRADRKQGTVLTSLDSQFQKQSRFLFSFRTYCAKIVGVPLSSESHFK